MFRIDYEEIVNQYPEGMALVALDIRFIATLLAVSNETLSYRATWGKPDNETFDKVTNLIHKGVDNLMSYKTLDDIFNLIGSKWDVTNSHLNDHTVELQNIATAISEIEGSGGIIDILTDILIALGGTVSGGGLAPSTLPYLAQLGNINSILSDMNSTGDSRTITDAITALRDVMQQIKNKPNVQYLPKVTSDNLDNLIVNGDFAIGSEFLDEDILNFKPDGWGKVQEHLNYPNKDGNGELTFDAELCSPIYQVCRVPRGYGGLHLIVESLINFVGIEISQLLDGEVIWSAVMGEDTFFEVDLYGNESENIEFRIGVANGFSSAKLSLIACDMYPVGVEEKNPKGQINKEQPVVNNIPTIKEAWEVVNYWGLGAYNFALEVKENALDMLKYISEGVTGVNYKPSGVEAEYTLKLHGRARAIQISGDFSPEYDESGEKGESYLTFIHRHPVQGDSELITINEPGGFSYEFSLEAMGGELVIVAYMNAIEDSDSRQAYFRDLKVITLTYDVGDDV